MIICPFFPSIYRVLSPPTSTTAVQPEQLLVLVGETSRKNGDRLQVELERQWQASARREYPWVLVAPIDIEPVSTST